MATALKGFRKLIGKRKSNTDKVVEKTDQEIDSPTLNEAETVEKSSSDPNDGFVVVAAIDFGTTYSGYAFAFTSKPDDIRVNKNWGENIGFQVKSIPRVIHSPKAIFRIKFRY